MTRIKLEYLLCILLLILALSCSKGKQEVSKKTTEETNIIETYTIGDFKLIRKIDVHAHINSKTSKMIDLAKENNFRLLNMAVDVKGHNYPSVRKQIEIREALYKESPGTMVFGTAFTLDGWDDPDWSDRVIKQLKSDFDLGAVSVKTWKNIGMDAKDKDGNLIFLDDPKFDPVFNFIKNQGKVYISHAGEPHNCWIPLDSMTVKNDFNYFSKHPEYHMFLHPEMPSYEDQIEHRNNRLVRNGDLPFIGAHMASLEWSVDRMTSFLDRFPNASLDLAERVSHIQYQSQRDRKKVRDFFIKYQDRILYATDFGEDNESVPAELEEYMMEVWQNDWKYFCTDEMVTVPQLDTPVKGLALPKTVIDKLYKLNAEAIFTNAWVK